MRTIEFEGAEFDYDERCVKSWKWQKALSSNDSTRVIGAVERLFTGRDEEYADVLCGNDDPDGLDTSFEKLTELAMACIQEAGGKN